MIVHDSGPQVRQLPRDLPSMPKTLGLNPGTSHDHNKVSSIRLPVPPNSLDRKLSSSDDNAEDYKEGETQSWASSLSSITTVDSAVEGTASITAPSTTATSSTSNSNSSQQQQTRTLEQKSKNVMVTIAEKSHAPRNLNESKLESDFTQSQTVSRAPDEPTPLASQSPEIFYDATSPKSDFTISPVKDMFAQFQISDLPSTNSQEYFTFKDIVRSKVSGRRSPDITVDPRASLTEDGDSSQSVTEPVKESGLNSFDSFTNTIPNLKVSDDFTPTVSRISADSISRRSFDNNSLNANNSFRQPQLPLSNVSTSSLPVTLQVQRSTSSSVIVSGSPAITSSPSNASSTINKGQGKQPPLKIQTNRNSISSQISVVSTQSARHSSLVPYRSSTTTNLQQTHRPSISFSRRRSVPVQSGSSQYRPTSLEHSDDDLSAEIKRLREAIVAQRESKKRRREFLEDERVLVGTKVSEGHGNYVTAYNMLTGIRVAVSRCNAKVNRELTDEDFTARHKLAFDVSGNELTPSAKYDFKFKDYSPWVFRHLRDLFKLDPADYLMSLTSKYIVSELGSPGKSGSFFYFSRDYRFIIKTIHHSEHKLLRKILKDYYNHVKNNPNTLISQFYGLHRVKLPFGRKIHFIVMNNLFPPHRDIHRTYDLKGSILGRELQESPDEKKSKVYKDINWLRRNEHINLGPIKREQFLHQLELDVTLLKRLNIMDYSLLIGIHDMSKGNTENLRDSILSVFEPNQGQTIWSKSKVAELRKAINSASPTALSGLDIPLETYGRNQFVFYADDGGYRATDENNRPLGEIYYLGVIDCLTPYTFFKRVETFVKGLSHSRASISAIPAGEYGDRFYKFIKSVVAKGPAKQTEPEVIEPAAEASTSIPETTNIRHENELDAPIHLPALTEASTEATNPLSNSPSLR